MKGFIAGVLATIAIALTLANVQTAEKPKPAVKIDHGALPGEGVPIPRAMAPTPPPVFVPTPIQAQPRVNAYVPPVPTAPKPRSQSRKGTFSPASGFNTPPPMNPPTAGPGTRQQFGGTPRVQRGATTYYQPAPQTRQVQQDQTVYVTNTGEKYHRAGCQYLRRSQIPIQLSAAQARYGPCSKCF